MPFCGCEIPLLAREKSDTTPTIIIADETRMYGRLTYKRVTAVSSVWNGGIFLGCSWSTNYVRLVVDFLVTDSMWVEHLHSLTIGRASESKGSIVKGATSVSIQTTAIAGIPTAVSIKHSWIRRAAHQKLAPHHIGCGLP